MGLRLPTGQQISKVLHTSLGFGLILLPTVLDSRWHGPYPLLYLVMVIRSCLLFRPLGRLLVASLAFLSFLLTLFLRVPRIPPAWLMAQEQIRSTVLTLKLNATLSFGLSLVFLLLLINAWLTAGGGYVDPGLDYYEPRYRERLESSLSL